MLYLIKQAHFNRKSVSYLTMTKTLAERLKYARLELGFQEIAEVARRAGITASALYQLEDGKSKSLNGETAVKLSKVYKPFRVEWLITGELPECEESDATHNTRVSKKTAGYVTLRMMEGWASCGYGAVNQDYPEVIKEIEMAEWQLRKQIGFIPEDDRVQLITTRGDSMYPEIKNGDVLFVDVAHTYFDGDGIYMINLHGMTYVKRLQILRDGLHVVSTNKNYSSEVVPANEIDQINISGKVLGLALLRSAQEI